MTKQSTENYKGVRDFYPEDQFIQKYIFETMARTCEYYGYEEYHASVLEPTELYRGKTSEEVVNEQTYTFTDRGGREVTLRPEMTPTVARMVARKRRELPFPLRLYSIANFFRYERPQRGRLREHWQVNADIFGVEGIEAEVEIIALTHRIMRALGATENDFAIHINDRRLLRSIFETLNLPEKQQKSVLQILDRRAKIDNFEGQIESILGPRSTSDLIEEIDRASSTAYLEELVSRLQNIDIGNVSIDTSVVRGFDYYTGVVFEVFDTSDENNRSLFGGGRYDNLLEMFGEEPIPAVGFGMGDVTARNFLEAHDLLPEYMPATELVLCPLEDIVIPHAMHLAEKLRDEDVAVSVNLSLKRAGEQVRYADKLGAAFVICIGEKEMGDNRYTIKHLASGDERTVSAESIADHMFSALG